MQICCQPQMPSLAARRADGKAATAPLQTLAPSCPHSTTDRSNSPTRTDRSKAYRKAHKKEKAARAEMDAQLGALDRPTAQRLQLRREVERVRERMTFKHRNSESCRK